MNKVFYAMLVMCAFAVIFHFTPHAKAAPFATMPNQSGGKIVLTDEICKIDGKTYRALSRAYSFISSGETIEGCFYLDNATESVVIVWRTRAGADTYRYPQDAFNLVAQPKERLIPT